jgi:hypothetical protein
MTGVAPPPFTLSYTAKVTLDLSFPDGMTVQDAERKAQAEGMSIAGMGQDYVLLRADSRAYVKLSVSPLGLVAGRLAIEGEDAADLDRRLWFTFRGLREVVAAELRVGAPVRDVLAQLRRLAPVSFDHLTNQYRPDLGSLRLYHFVGGGVIGLEVDPMGTVTAASLLPPKVGQGSVLALEAQERDAPLAWNEPRPVAGLRAALDDVLAKRADIVGVRELDPTGDAIEITGRGDDATRRYRYRLGARGKVGTA